METHKSDPIKQIEKIETWICELQRSHIALQQRLKEAAHQAERHIADSALRIIDILDVIDKIEPTTTTMDEAHHETPLDAQWIIKKIQKRLKDILQCWQIKEILLKDNKIEIGKVRVLETRKKADNIEVGQILAICRKGYQRGDTVIRPVDVISASNSV